MKPLVVTEKSRPTSQQRDGGARLLQTLKRGFGEDLAILQFDDYPYPHPNRFERRLLNGCYIAEKIRAVQDEYTHIIFVHVSMQFGLVEVPLNSDLTLWTFPMFLTPSYVASGETVPKEYFEREKAVLARSSQVLTPSPLERRQLEEVYEIPSDNIRMVPRGVVTDLLIPKVRELKGPLRCCSVGSIKPQKNALELLDLFSTLKGQYPDATLSIIGPIQDEAYGNQVQEKIRSMNLIDAVEMTGHVHPASLGKTLLNFHLHLSTSAWETFGRAIFETLSSGIPGIAKREGNASADFLEERPYIRFYDDDPQAAVDAILLNYKAHSEMAMEVGELFEEAFLSTLLVAALSEKETLAIVDYDGTLFHKTDPEKTKRSFDAFLKFSKRVLCSARPLDDLLEKAIDVDWIISSSGACIATGDGDVLWEATDSRFSREETYQGETHTLPWDASKLKASLRLLKMIRWKGRVTAFGDSPYDRELVTFFDGKMITPAPTTSQEQKEIQHV